MARTLEQISEIMEKCFPTLIELTHELVSEVFRDNKNYAHYFGRSALIYQFVFINKICKNQGFDDSEATFLVMRNVFRACGLDESIANAGIETAMDLSLQAAQQKSKLLDIIIRLADTDAVAFNWTEVSQTHADHYALAIALDHPAPGASL